MDTTERLEQEKLKTEADKHILQLPQSVEFDVTDDYDYLRRSPFKSLWYFNLRSFAHIILNIYNRLVFGLKVKGYKNITEIDGGGVIICNHVHFMDCGFIDCVFSGRRVYYTTLETNFRIPVARHFIRWFGGVPIPRKVHMQKSFYSNMCSALEQGDKVCVYPEGVLYPYYKGLRTFHDGAFHLAAMTNCPIIPCVITFRKPKGIMRFIKKKPYVNFEILPAINVEEQDERRKAKLLKDMCKTAMKEKIDE